VFHKLIAVGLLFMMVSTISGQNRNTNDEAKRLQALFAEDWQWGLQQFPETATWLGDNRYNHRLIDLSSEAVEQRKAHEREMLNRIQQIDRAKLSGQDVISYDLYLRDKKINVEGQRFAFELRPLNQMEGLQLGFAQLADAMPFNNARDYENYLARLRGFATLVDQTIGLMKRGMEKKFLPPAVPMRSVPSQIEGQIVKEASKSPLYQPFNKFPKELSAAEQKRLSEAGRQAINESVLPSLKKLAAFVKQEYLPACPENIAASALPDGEALYAFAARQQTTTNLPPKEIHEIGKAEVKRIRGEMEEVIRRAKFKGSFQQFLTYLRTNPRFYYTRAEDLVTGYRDICKRVDLELPKFFAELPRNPYGVRVIPDYEAPAQTTAYYQQGAADGSRAGVYWANTYKLNTRPKYEMEALSLHEAVPGHHLQISRAQELKALPEFRRNAGYTAYVEGWALYAESLGEAMGFYTDPYSKFGQLTYEMWRACRLVVDTGMHSLGWTREQAIKFMSDNTAKTVNDIIVEIDRYIVWPGQALAYKIGELKIKELRGKAKAELGEHFDVRKFHNALLDDGPLPLDILEKRIEEWIAGQKKVAGSR
jgi:uncharacterized protein (DUF885 family)